MAALAAPPSGPSPFGPGPLHRSIPPRLLLLDGDPHRRSMAARALAEDGHHVEGVSTLAALRAADPSSRCTCVVAERHVGDGDALEVVADLYATGTMAAMVVVSGPDGTGDRVDALAAGADDHLLRPMCLPELVVRVRRLLTARSDAAGLRAAPIRIGPLTIDRDRKSVRLGGTDVAVTPTQYRLLEELAVRRGRVVTIRELLALGWDAHQQVGACALRPQLARLRRGLRGAVELRCVRGVGYVLEAAPAAPRLIGSFGRSDHGDRDRGALAIGA